MALLGAMSLAGMMIKNSIVLLDEIRDARDLWDQRQRIARAPDEVKQLFVQLYFQYLDRFMQRRGSVAYH